MKKFPLFVATFVLSLSLALGAYAGEGSDTVGDGKLLPELRYSYSQTELKTDFPLLSSGEYNLTQHDVYLQLYWGLNPNVDIYGLVGARFESFDADVIDSPLLGGFNINAAYDTSANFLYGLGVKATFYRADNGFYIGGGLLFTHSFGEDKDLELSGDVLGMDLATLVGDFPTKISTRMITLTPDIHAGWHFKNIGLTPYVGLEYRWAWAEASYDIGQVTGGIIDGDFDLNFQQEDSFGIFAGIDYRVNDRLSFNVEGNLLDRWGVSASVGYLFDINGKPRSATPAYVPRRRRRRQRHRRRLPSPAASALFVHADRAPHRFPRAQQRRLQPDHARRLRAAQLGRAPQR